MDSPSRVTVVPLLGPFHTRSPLYNVVHVRALLQALKPDALALGDLPPGALDSPAWQATEQVALPHTVVPWAQRSKLPTYAVGSVAGQPGEPGEAGDTEAFMRYLGEFEAGRAHLRQLQAALGPVQELVSRGLDLGRVLEQLLPALERYDTQRRELFGEGPGTGWLEARASRTAERVAALPHEHVAVLVGVDDFGALARALGERVTVQGLPTRLDLDAATTREARERSLLDVAMRGEVEEPAALLAQLRELGTPEARYHEANLLLTHGHPAEALEVLKGVAGGEFHEPYYLPGFVLARLGELCDLAGDRQAALRAYRGALALSFAPPEAVASAQAGMKQPFDPGAAAAQ